MSSSYGITSQAFWVRVAYMVLFSFLAYCALVVNWILVVIQLAVTAISGSPNEQVQRFGASLGQFMSHAIAYLTFASEEKPFPFQDWPSSNAK